MENQNQSIGQSNENEENEQKQEISTNLIPTTPKTFHPFPRLPKELRLKIWKFSLPIGRKIMFEPITKYPPPAILHTNSESREEALSHLHIVDMSLCIPGRREKFFVHLDFDIFYPSPPLSSGLNTLIETLDDLLDLGFAQVAFTDQSWQFLLVLCAEIEVVYELKKIWEEEKDVKSVVLHIDREERRLDGLEVVWGWEWSC